MEGKNLETIRMTDKKGQTEDIAEIIIAIILIVITVIIISGKQAEHETGTSTILSSDKNSIKAIDLITLLRSPAMQITLQKEGFSEVKDVNFAEFFSIIYHNYPDGLAGYEWLFDDFIDTGLTTDTLSCELSFTELITNFLGYSSWSLKFYNLQGKKIFECDNLGAIKAYAKANGYYAEFNTTIPSPEGNDFIIEMEIVE